MSSIAKIKLKPDLEKIANYLTPYQMKRALEEGYVTVEPVFDQEDGDRYKQQLEAVIDKHFLNELRDELLVVIFVGDEDLNEALQWDRETYDGINAAIEVSNFLLAIKQADNNHSIQIGIKQNSGTANRPSNKNYFISDQVISKWMGQLIVDAVESGKYPGFEFGDIFRDSIAGLNITGEKQELKIENLKNGASLKNRSFNVYKKRRQVHFCLHIKTFLDKYSILNAPEEVKITDAQANFFFDILSVLGYLNPDDIESEPKDYISAMIRNHTL
jgi:hypothetical protein